MLFDSIRLSEGSGFTNLVIASGTSYPNSPDLGELFFRTDSDALFIYDGTQWQQVGNDTALLSTGGTMTGSLVLAADPTSSNQAATKQYVDNIAAGLTFKNAVRMATTANVILNGLQVIDGVTQAEGERILVKNQTAGQENGIYVCSAGNWTRSSDADNTPTGEVVAGMFVFVTEGSLAGDTGWVLTTNNPIVLGTTPLSFVQFSAGGAVASVAGKTGVVTLTQNDIDGLTTSSSPTFNVVNASLSGNANTATQLQTARLINGVSFNGTSDISISASVGAGATLDYPVIAGAYSYQMTTANSGTAYTVNTVNGSIHFVTMTGNCTFTFPTPAAGKVFTLMLKQDGVGSRTASWPASVKWPGNTGPVLSTAGNRMDKLDFVSDGTYWMGIIEGLTYDLRTFNGYRFLRFTFLANAQGSYAELPELRYLVGATAYPTVNMTSNSAPSPLVATASTQYDGNALAYTTFDGNINRGAPSYGWLSSGGVANEWLQLDFGSGNTVAPTGVRITPWSDGGQTSRLPTSFRIDGSDTGTFTGEQTTIYTGTATWPATNAVQTFTF